MSDAGAVVKAKIRRDLLSAAKARRSDETRLLRVLLGAFDNAEAVPVGRAHERYKARMFGDPSVEVPRRVLDEDAVRALLLSEQSERIAAAKEFDALGRADEARRLESEAALIGRYL
ncbi:MAG: hypothetical protein JO261_10010 [Alphaproteobacteria bacterium]|nr:hypothetical protein [Alphaproteobacteria bacterium]MBV9694023.1 hypothetical protein [Alphaproteobacteria bacterium]